MFLVFAGCATAPAIYKPIPCPPCPPTIAQWWDRIPNENPNFTAIIPPENLYFIFYGSQKAFFKLWYQMHPDSILKGNEIGMYFKGNGRIEIWTLVKVFGGKVYVHPPITSHEITHHFQHTDFKFKNPDEYGL